jgi:glycosyltransferase domain-containing protein
MTTPALEHWLETTLREPRRVEAADRAMLEKLTVVVPCYGRQDFLLRQCAYWHGTGVRLIIVDGSEQALPPSTQGLMAGLADVRYLHAHISMMERLKLAADRLETPYAILLGDDEFLLYAGLASAMRELERNPALVACIAQSLAFYPPAAGGRCTYGEGYPHWRYAVMQDDPGQRLQAAMSDYTAATCYAVLRTPVWQRSWGQLRNWSSPYVGEMQQGITTYIWGKLTTVDEVYWMRSSENRPVTNKGFNRGLSFQEWWEATKFSVEHQAFLEILKSELVEASPSHALAAESVITQAIHAYLQHLNHLKVKHAASSQGLWTQFKALRQYGVKLAKACLPDAIVGHLKSAKFAASHAVQYGALGSLDDVQRNLANHRFLLSESLSYEILDMESLVVGFYHARMEKAQ